MEIGLKNLRAGWNDATGLGVAHSGPQRFVTPAPHLPPTDKTLDQTKYGIPIVLITSTIYTGTTIGRSNL
jgi:hypothetical protein